MNDNKFTWGYLLHLGFHFWADAETKRYSEPTNMASDHLKCEKSIWNETVDSLKKNGCNTIVIDLGEGVKYESHPELAIKGSWSKNELADEIARLKGLGFEVLPKFNFSTGHDEWLGEYSKMVSTPTYYKVRDDLIDEASELFDNPRLFHLGMDEEVYSIQQGFSYCVIREGDLYWHDQDLLFKRVQKNGVRPWIWADYIWHTPERQKLFLERMTKEVLLSNWYYWDFEVFNDFEDDCGAAFKILEEHGFDQLPTASTYFSQTNIESLINHSKETIAPERLKGIIMTSWKPTSAEFRDTLLKTSDILGEAVKKYGNNIYR